MVLTIWGRAQRTSERNELSARSDYNSSFYFLFVVAVLPNHVVVAALIDVLALVAAVALAAAAQALALVLADAPSSWLPCLARASATLCCLFLRSSMLQHCLVHSRASHSFAKSGSKNNCFI